MISADMISQICVEERVPLNESGMRITLFMNGHPFDLHLAVNFLDWSTYPTVNDNLCWVVLIVCLVVAGGLCIVGTKKRIKQ